MIEIVAEIGINHNGDIPMALDMIEQAQAAGADVAKFQVYNPRQTLDLEHPLIKQWWDVIRDTELALSDVHTLAGHCERVGIEFLASVFQPERVAWLESVHVRRYKIASRSIYDEPLAEAIAQTGKPVILSYGWYTGKPPAIDRFAEPERVTRLACVSEYPAPIEGLFDPDAFRLEYYDGLSDHTPSIWASIVAMSLGATMIEKHVTMGRNLSGPDHAASITFDELRQLCEARDVVEQLLYPKERIHAAECV